MSDDRMFERNAQAWLEVGPSSAPKRVVDEALRTIATTPQQRDLRAPWRLPHLKLNTRFALVAAVALAVVGAGVLIWRSPQNQIGNPSPSPAASPLTLEMLQGAWASVGTRDDPIGDHANPPLVESMVIDATGLRIQSFVSDIASSGSIVSADGQLRLRMDAPQELLTRRSWECTTGDNGTYHASLSADQQTLTLASAGDDCATRGDILTGDWSRWPCPDLAQYAYCDHVSELAPGRYIAPLFRPFHNGTTGQLAYTLPGGWAKLLRPPTWPTGGGPSELGFTRFDSPETRAINVFANLHPSDSQAVRDGLDLSCQSGIGSFGTAAQTADFLESQPFLSVSGRGAVTIGGLAGVQIDVSLIPGFVDPCSWSTDSAGAITYSTDIEIFQNAANEPVIYLDSAGDAFARFILLDGPGAHLVIEVSAPDQSSLDARLAAAVPVIGSFELISDPNPSPSSISQALQRPSKWWSVGGRPWAHAVDPVLSDITFGPGTLTIYQFKGDIKSSWSIDEDGRLTMGLLNNSTDPPFDREKWPCEVGDQGSYDVSISADGGTMTLSPISDLCATRADILSGDWAIEKCPTYAEATCLGLSPSPTAVSAIDLQATWTSVGTRPIPGAVDQVTVFTIGAHYLDIHQRDGDVKNSWVLFDDPINRISVYGPLDTDGGLTARWGCFGIGEYDVSLSPDRATLTWTPVDEACAQRQAILAGDWTREVAAEPSPQ